MPRTKSNNTRQVVFLYDLESRLSVFVLASALFPLFLLGTVKIQIVNPMKILLWNGDAMRQVLKRLGHSTSVHLGKKTSVTGVKSIQ